MGTTSLVRFGLAYMVMRTSKKETAVNAGYGSTDGAIVWPEYFNTVPGGTLAQMGPLGDSRILTWK